MAKELSEKHKNGQFLLVLHCHRILAILDENSTDSANIYVHLRSLSLLDVAIYLAQVIFSIFPVECFVFGLATRKNILLVKYLETEI